MFERYVAIGDSSTAGFNDPDDNGGFRGWSRRLAARLAEVQGGLMYANLGVAGLKTREILEQQLEPAVSLRPDLVTMFTGTNDVIGRGFDAQSVARDVEHMHRTLIDSGATVLTFTLPDLTPIMPIARWVAPRIHAMNDALRQTTERTGATLVDFATYPVATDKRLWHEDRIHANSAGHARIAAALMFALGLPETDATWGDPLPSLPAPPFGSKVIGEIAWVGRYFLPWIGTGVRARLSGREREVPRPVLESIGGE